MRHYTSGFDDGGENAPTHMLGDLENDLLNFPITRINTIARVTL
jgi:hypothetical protein